MSTIGKRRYRCRSLSCFASCTRATARLPARRRRRGRRRKRRARVPGCAVWWSSSLHRRTPQSKKIARPAALIAILPKIFIVTSDRCRLWAVREQPKRGLQFLRKMSYAAGSQRNFTPQEIFKKETSRHALQIRLLRSCGTFPMESALLMGDNRVARARNNQTAPGSDAQPSAILTMPDYFFAQTPDPA